MCKNGFTRKLRLIAKFLTSQTQQQIIKIYTLLNISRGKDNQTMTFDHLIDYNARNIFHEKSYTKFGGETSPRPIYKSK